MRTRVAYVSVVLTGLALVGAGLHGMRDVDTTLRVAAASHAAPSAEQVLEHHGRDCPEPAPAGDRV